MTKLAGRLAITLRKRPQRAQAREPSEGEISDLLQLISDIGRTKLSLNSLVVRPIWRDSLLEDLQREGLNADEGGDSGDGYWVHLFYYLGRVVQREPSGSINMRRLAEEFGAPLSTATRIADQMVQRGLLERHSDAHDRRVVLLRLTSSGERALAVIDRATQQHLKAMLAQFSARERRQILYLGRRILNLWHASLRSTAPDILTENKSKILKGEVPS